MVFNGKKAALWGCEGAKLRHSFSTPMLSRQQTSWKLLYARGNILKSGHFGQMSISVLANKAYTYKINMGKNLDEFSRFKRITSLCDTAAAFFAKAYYSCNTAGRDQTSLLAVKPAARRQNWIYCYVFIHYSLWGPHIHFKASAKSKVIPLLVCWT